MHTRIRQTMRSLYRGELRPTFLDATASRFLEEGKSAYEHLGLDENVLLDQGSHFLLLTWAGDAANEAIACLLGARDFNAQAGRLGVEVTKGSQTRSHLLEAMAVISSQPAPRSEELLVKAKNLASQKWDGLLPPRLLMLSYASQRLDLTEGLNWLKSMPRRQSG